jgi:hypothetical protein
VPFKPPLRRVLLTAHVVFSVGWLGAIIAFALGSVGLARVADVAVIRAVYPALEMIGWYALVPFSVAALLTGIVQSLGTEWGLFRYYWVAAKLVLTAGATGLLLVHMRAVSRAAILASSGVLDAEFSRLQARLVIDATLAAIVLLVATVLSIYKPGGLTAYGASKQRKSRGSSAARRRHGRPRHGAPAHGLTPWDWVF